MHTLVFVTVNADRNASSEQVRSQVFLELDVEGFVHPGRFSGGWGDWFVLGGRWSGELSRRLDEPDANGDVPVPYGHEGDAMIVTRELYDACLKPFEGEYQERPSWTPGGLPGFIDLDAEEVSPETHIAPAEGERADTVKWLVVVDLHS
jgi:hypothetical protein